jgi:hypothetical protein
MENRPNVAYNAAFPLVACTLAVCEFSAVRPVFEQMLSVGMNSVSRLLQSVDVECISTFSSSMLRRWRLCAAETSAVRSKVVVFNLGYAYPRGYTKTS